MHKSWRAGLYFTGAIFKSHFRVDIDWLTSKYYYTWRKVTVF